MAARTPRPGRVRRPHPRSGHPGAPGRRTPGDQPSGRRRVLAGGAAGRGRPGHRCRPGPAWLGARAPPGRGCPPGGRRIGAARGAVVVLDELGFHPATSVAELLAARLPVEVITSALVVGQDLGLTLDLELWTRTAHALGVRQRTDVVVLDAREDAAGRLLPARHPAGAGQQLARDRWPARSRPGPPTAVARAAGASGAPRTPVGDCLAPRRAHAACSARAGAALGRGRPLRGQHGNAASTRNAASAIGAASTRVRRR